MHYGYPYDKKGKNLSDNVQHWGKCTAPLAEWINKKHRGKEQQLVKKLASFDRTTHARQLRAEHYDTSKEFRDLLEACADTVSAQLSAIREALMFLAVTPQYYQGQVNSLTSRRADRASSYGGAHNDAHFATRR